MGRFCLCHEPILRPVARPAKAAPNALALAVMRSYKPVLPLRHHGSRRGGRVVDRAALEMRSTRKGTGGSNPSLSAIASLACEKMARLN